MSSYPVYPVYPTFGGGTISGPVAVPIGTSASQQVINDQTAIDAINQKLKQLTGLGNSPTPSIPDSGASPKKSTLDTILGDGSLFSSLDILGRAGAAADTALGTGSASLDKFFGLSISRFVAVILGLIFIAGGIYLFKPTQQVINKTVKAVV